MSGNLIECRARTKLDLICHQPLLLILCISPSVLNRRGKLDAMERFHFCFKGESLRPIVSWPWMTSMFKENQNDDKSGLQTLTQRWGPPTQRLGLGLKLSDSLQQCLVFAGCIPPVPALGSYVGKLRRDEAWIWSPDMLYVAPTWSGVTF